MSNLASNLWMLAAGMAVISLFIAGFCIYQFKHQNPGLRFQTRITDLWALVLGLSPAFYWCCQSPGPVLLPILVTILIGQSLGGFWMHLLNETGSLSSKQTSFGAAVNIFVGTLIGVFAPIFIVIAFACFLGDPMLVYGSLTDGPSIFRKFGTRTRKETPLDEEHEE
jgi:hypothetical protein